MLEFYEDAPDTRLAYYHDRETECSYTLFSDGIGIPLWTLNDFDADKLIEGLRRAIEERAYLFDTPDDEATIDIKRWRSDNPIFRFEYINGLVDKNKKSIDDDLGYLTILIHQNGRAVFDPPAVSHYIALDWHKRIVRETDWSARRDITSIVAQEVQKGVSRGVEKAVADKASALEKIEAERKSLIDQRQEIERKLAKLEKVEAKLQEREAAKANREPRSTAGYVYLLKEINGPHWKIGHTSNPDNRAKTFKVTIPYQVKYDHLIETEDMKALESELHARFAHCRVDGEWFALTPADVDYIKSL